MVAMSIKVVFAIATKKVVAFAFKLVEINLDLLVVNIAYKKFMKV